MIYKVLFLFIAATSILCAQNENINAEHPIYDFLQKMKIRGIISDYDNTVIPLSKSRLKEYIKTIETRKELLFEKENEELELFSSYLTNLRFGDDKNQFNILKIEELLLRDENISLYSYFDGEFDLRINPVFSLRSIVVDKPGEITKNSLLIGYGGELILNYSDWLGIYLNATNGANIGDRETARLDRRVKQSFAFNYTNLDYFDNTEGYIQIKNKIAKLQVGRERVLWGSGNINRAFLDQTPQLFDFIKFDIKYNIFSLNFIHGWLVEKSDTFIQKPSLHEIRTKADKYFAISRFGIRPWENLNLGISQSVVYTQRPFELAYLNPFLLWESAQRSMNDLDNSFLGFDIKYNPVKGLEMYGTLLFDDINFDYFFNEKWNSNGNGNLWQAGLALSNPLLVKNMMLTIEYMQVRPFTFSHPGFQTGLAYTNNGAMLCSDIEPNSTLFSLQLEYQVTSRFKAILAYENYMHGKNIYDSGGNLINNIGGDVFESYSVFTDQRIKILSGDLEVENRYSIILRYYLSAKLHAEIMSRYFVHSNNSFQNKQMQIFSTIYYNTNFH
ncbi:MAG TPA: capsule assembly Wzi family protein [Ignavibacteriaceae bacterium]|nr:capsule assembly Wzi family protein [Ignavibacteriaceae bacterium]